MFHINPQYSNQIIAYCSHLIYTNDKQLFIHDCVCTCIIFFKKILDIKVNEAYLFILVEPVKLFLLFWLTTERYLWVRVLTFIYLFIFVHLFIVVIYFLPYPSIIYLVG